MRRTSTFLFLLTFASLSYAQLSFFKVRVENTSQAYDFPSSGVFAVPVDSAGPGPIFPGASYSFTFQAAAGQYLSFATMYVQSNDLFFAPDEMGIPLYDMDGNPNSGDITDQLLLWDSGTEINQQPGVGVDQAPRQAAGNTGDVDPDNTVRIVNDEFTYAAVEEVIQATLTYDGGNQFTVNILNVSDASTQVIDEMTSVPVPMAPGVYVVHSAPAPLFTTGEPDRGLGLEGIAEDGAASMLGDYLAGKTGVTGVLAPGVYAVHTENAPLFTNGMPDRGLGLEGIAEDGAAGMLAANLYEELSTTGDVFAVPAGASGPGPLTPGNAYEFVIAAKPGSKLSLATMYVQSNDLFYAPGEAGIDLFDMDGNPIEGDITDQLELWDAGTEENQYPGVGADQAPRQSGPDTGAADSDNTVRIVNDGFPYPANEDVLSVTVTPLETTNFFVRLQNVSTAATLVIDENTTAPVPLSPGVWAVHTASSPLFANNSNDRGLGLEDIAEDGTPGPLNMALENKAGLYADAFAVPAGATDPAPIFPGDSYEFMIAAAPGSYLSFATMFIQSNDLFLGPDVNGIPLFDGNGDPAFGDVTDQVLLWDGGTELNEQPGVGMNQAPRQTGPDTGNLDTDDIIRLVNDEFTYPEVNEVIRVTLSATSTVSNDPLIDELSSGITLAQSYPNPFSSTTVIPFSLTESSDLRISVLDVVGREVAELVNGFIPAGEHTVAWDGAGAETGIYFYRLETAEGSLVRRLIKL